MTLVIFDGALTGTKTLLSGVFGTRPGSDGTQRRGKRRKFQEQPAQGSDKPKSRWEDDQDAGQKARVSSDVDRRKTGKGPKKIKRVRWADQVGGNVGFSIGGAAKQQLEQVFIVEGLGPGRRDTDTSKPEPPPATLRAVLFGGHHINNIDGTLKR
eukprot:scaffold34920_cov28-Prasinocladus_malaysianus.AAC.1